MSFKNKIKGYKAKVDLEAWQGMESLLDNQSQIEESKVAKSGFLANIRKWFFLIGIVLAIIAGSIYIFSSNQNANSSLSENIENGETNNGLEQSSIAILIEEDVIEEDVIEEDVIGLEAEDLSIKNNVEEPQNETSRYESAQLQSNTDANLAEPSDLKTQSQQNVNTKKKTSSGDVKPQIKAVESDNSFGNELKDKKAKIESNDIGNLGINETNRLKEEISADPLSNENPENFKNLVNTENEGNGSSILEQNSNAISESDISQSSDKANDLNIVSLLDIENLERTQLGILKSNQEVFLGAPDFIIPSKILSPYLIGLDIGETQYLAGVAGLSVSVFGLYEVSSNLRGGLRFNRSKMSDKANYIVSPEIKRRKIETSIELYVQFLPLRLWRFDFGIEGGFGTTFVQDKYRRSENPEPNIISIREEIRNYNSNWFHAGAHFTFDITSSIKVGASVGSNIGTESAHVSGRLVFRI